MLLLVAVASARGDLLNPGFANNGGAGSTANNWTGSGKQGVQSWGSHDGDGWMQAFWGWGAGTSAQLYQDVAGAADTVYTLSFWQEGDDAYNGTAFSVTLGWYDSGMNLLGSVQKDLQPWAGSSAGWISHSLMATSTVGTATVRVQFDATSLADGAGAGKVDDLGLAAEAIPEPTVVSLIGLGLMLMSARRLRGRA